MTDYNYTFPVNQLLTLGDPRNRKGDLSELGITSEHIPELIRLLEDDAMALADSESTEVWGSLYAWRMLGELKAVEALDALLEKMIWADEVEDDWAPSELPGVFAKIGPAAIPALTELLEGAYISPNVGANAGEALVAIAQEHAETRSQSIEVLTQRIQSLLEKGSDEFDDDDEQLTTFLVGSLIDLKALESLSVIEAAYRADRIDPSLYGDWEDAQIQLGIKAERDTPTPNYFSLQEERMQTRKAKTGLMGTFKEKQQRQAAEKAKKKNKRKMEAKSKKKNRKKK